jgi:hypothetical protein
MKDEDSMTEKKKEMRGERQRVRERLPDFWVEERGDLTQRAQRKRAEDAEKRVCGVRE